jgi:hypothetical protein
MEGTSLQLAILRSFLVHKQRFGESNLKDCRIVGRDLDMQ